MIFNILFIGFSFILLAAALVVVLSKNTVHSALGLIIAFINGAILSLMMRAETIAFVIMIVYVGAVAVLFLFVVMMIDLARFKERLMGRYFPIIATVMVLLVIEMLALSYGYSVSPSAPDMLAYPRPKNTQNIVAIGQLLYTHYLLAFQVSGIVLFVAMIGAIVLTLGLKNTPHLKRQNVTEQNLRSKDRSLVLTNPQVRQGISEDTIYHLVNYDTVESPSS